MNQINIMTGDHDKSHLLPGKIPVTIVLDRLRSAFNTGNIFRLSEAIQVEKIITCGYTPTPPHEKLSKTARGCEERVPFEHAEDSYIAVKALKAKDYHIYAVETVEGATPLWDCKIQYPAAFVFGNEALGIEPKTLELCDDFIILPCFGEKNSINVGNCAGVVLYEALHQWLQHFPQHPKQFMGPTEQE